MIAKCRCIVCNEHLEFDEANAGAKITCPHCRMETVLYVPMGTVEPTRQSGPTQPERPARLKLDTIAIVLAIACATTVLSLVIGHPSRSAWEYKTDVSYGPSDFYADNDFAGSLLNYAGNSGWEIVAAWPKPGEPDKMCLVEKRRCAEKSDERLSREGDDAIKRMHESRDARRKGVKPE